MTEQRESGTRWILVEKLADSHTKITEQQMLSDDPIPPVRSEKVWVEGEIVKETDERVTIDNGDEWFTQDRASTYEELPANTRRKTEPLDDE